MIDEINSFKNEENIWETALIQMFRTTLESFDQERMETGNSLEKRGATPGMTLHLRMAKDLMPVKISVRYKIIKNAEYSSRSAHWGAR